MLHVDFLAIIGMATTVDAVVQTCPRVQCPVDMRPMECRAMDIDDEMKAALCRGEPSSPT